MKSTTTTRTLKRAALVAAAFLTFAMSSTFAQTGNYKLSDKEIANLKAGIQSENEGVKRCMIYFTGKYAMNDLVEPLIDQLKCEKNPSIRHLIVLSLYKIGNAYGMEAVREVAAKDTNSRVKRLAAAIYDEYVFENEHKFFSYNE